MTVSWGGVASTAPWTRARATPVPKGRDNWPRRVATPVTIIVTVCTRLTIMRGRKAAGTKPNDPIIVREQI